MVYSCKNIDDRRDHENIPVCILLCNLWYRIRAFNVILRSCGIAQNEQTAAESQKELTLAGETKF